jgi:hypothetical protein
MGDQASAVGWTRRAVREAPLDEQVHRRLMVRLAEAGERAEALVVFERLEAAPLADVGVAPSPATVELAHRLAGRRPAAAQGRVIEESALCRAPALEVMKLLQDPLRYREWWDGLTDAQPTAEATVGVEPAAWEGPGRPRRRLTASERRRRRRRWPQVGRRPGRRARQRRRSRAAR